MSKKETAKSEKAEAAKSKAPPDGASTPRDKPSLLDLDERQFLLISKALADPTRFAILRNIARGQSACSGMRDCLGVSAATLSHHMKELENAGLITLTRDGRFVHAELDRKLWKKYIHELKAVPQ